jgi:hypothetical protein
MSLSLDLQKLPPQALDIIRYLATTTQGADVDEIIQGTGLSERAFGKAIRRLVTRYYVQMPSQGYYVLTNNGKEAAEVILEYDGGIPPVSEYVEENDPPASMPESAVPTVPTLPAPLPQAPPPVPAAAPPPSAAVLSAHTGPRHPRRLSVLVAQEMVTKSTSLVLAGLDAPISGMPSMNQPAELIIRINAPGCDVEPVERPLTVSPDKPAGPVQFRVKPRREGTIRIKVEAYQFVTHRDIVPLGGMYFDRHVAPLPTVLSAEFKALGTTIQLFPGDKK